MVQTRMPVANAKILQASLLGCALLVFASSAYQSVQDTFEILFGSLTLFEILTLMTDMLPCLVSLFEAIAFFWLFKEVERRRHAVGLSERTLEAFLVVFALRACMLLFDFAGGRAWLFGIQDLLSLAFLVRIMLLRTSKKQDEVAEDEDSVMRYLIPGCAVLACLMRPDMSESSLYNFWWGVSHYVAAVAVAPQALLLTKQADSFSQQGLLKTYAALAISRVLDMVYWSNVAHMMAPENGGFNLSGFTILAANSVGLGLIAYTTCLTARGYYTRKWVASV